MKWPGITVSDTKAVILIKIICLVWFVAKIISFKLWIADRHFPVVPTFDFLSSPNEAHLALFIFSLIGIASIFIFPNNRKILLGFICIEIFSCLLDQMRWQPWEYQYLLTFIIFFFSKGNMKQFLLLFIFLIAVTYIFSGIHKFSGSFLYSFWDQIVLYRLLHLPYNVITDPYIHYSGLLLSIIEILIGVGFIFFRNKWFFGLLAIILHLMIILIFGPTGINYNTIILPWNIAMIVMIGVVFYKKEHLNFTFDFFKNKLNAIIFLLVGLLPILNFFDKWDSYLSFNLYSGNTKTLVICSDDAHEYPELKQYQSKTKNSNFCNNTFLINTQIWALDELKVPVYPEERIYKKIQHSFNQKYPNVKNTFVYYVYPYENKNIIEIR